MAEKGPTSDFVSNEKNSKLFLRLIREYGLPHTRWFALGLGSNVLGRVVSLLPALVLGIAIDTIFRETGTFSLPFVPQSWIPTTMAGQVWFVTGILAASYVLSAIVSWAQTLCFTRFSLNLSHDLRLAAYDKVQRLDIGFFHKNQTGELLGVLSSDVGMMKQAMTGTLAKAIELTTIIVVIAATVVLMNWQLALVTFAFMPIVAWAASAFKRHVGPQYAELRSTHGKFNTRLENNLAGIETIKTFGTEDEEARRVGEASIAVEHLSWKATKASAIFKPGLGLLGGAAWLTTFLVGGLMVAGANPLGLLFTPLPLTLGAFVSFIFMNQRLIQPMSQFGGLVNEYEKAMASARRVFGLMDTKVHVEEVPDADRLMACAGRVEYKNVTFGYVPDAPVFENVSFVAQPGERIGIVGTTGAGKSTVTKLLPRFYDAMSGTIELDGRDIKSLSIEELRHFIGYVGQEPYMFEGTLEENIKYGSPNATREEVIAAAKRADAHEFIANTKKGYETKVGQRGAGLSGGQRQRISLARVLLRNPRILILDEATSALDPETESRIQRSLEEFSKGRTVFSIAHRLSTIRDSDRIMVMSNGGIAEMGPHDELVQKRGIYAGLWEAQHGPIPPQEGPIAVAATTDGSRSAPAAAATTARTPKAAATPAAAEENTAREGSASASSSKLDGAARTTEFQLVSRRTVRGASSVSAKAIVAAAPVQ